MLFVAVPELCAFKSIFKKTYNLDGKHVNILCENCMMLQTSIFAMGDDCPRIRRLFQFESTEQANKRN